MRVHGMTVMHGGPAPPRYQWPSVRPARWSNTLSRRCLRMSTRKVPAVHIGPLYRTDPPKPAKRYSASFSCGSIHNRAKPLSTFGRGSTTPASTFAVPPSGIRPATRLTGRQRIARHEVPHIIHSHTYCILALFIPLHCHLHAHFQPPSSWPPPLIT